MVIVIKEVLIDLFKFIPAWAVRRAFMISFSYHLDITGNISGVYASAQMQEYRGVFRTLSNV